MTRKVDALSMMWPARGRITGPYSTAMGEGAEKSVTSARMWMRERAQVPEFS